MSNRHILPLICGLIAAMGLIAACSSDDGPTTPNNPPDTTAPEVVGVDPEPDEVSVSLDDSVFVVFSEAMDPATAAGAVTMSAGTVTGYTWYTSRILAVAHTDWPAGTEVTVTLGTGLADVAGNALAAPYTYSFWTETTDLVLFSSTPANGATGVNRDAGIILVFSQDVQTPSLESHVTISDAVTKAVFPYTVNRLETGRYLLDPTATLPASTTIYVTVAAGLQASFGGATLQNTTVIQFTTGTAVDNTPPTVVSTVPTSGATSVPTNQGFFRMTFSEPMDTDSIEPSRWNLELYLLLMQAGAEPTWSQNNTVLTVPLPTLPAGLPMELTFVGFRDLAGNAQGTPYTWTATAQGTADYVPVVDNAQYAEEVYSEWGNIGNPTPVGDDSWGEYLQIEVQSGSDFRLVSYADWQFTIPTGDWEGFRKTSTALMWTGFQDGGGAKARRDFLKNFEKTDFDAPLTILPLPLSVRNWTSSTTVTIPGEGTFAASLQGRVLGKFDEPIPQSGGEVFLKDAWKVVRTLSVTSGGEPAFTEVDTVWYSASLGEVHRKLYETDHLASEWYTEDAWRFPPFLTKSRFGGRAGF